MNDQQIERVLRTTLADRADTVTAGPEWNGPEALDRRPASLRSSARWLAPLAAAVVVAAVAGGVIAYRSTTTHPAALTRAPAFGNQLPIPKGMQAVDALGVEIFVPSDFTLDDFCAAHGVIRPVVFARLPSCPARPDRTVARITTASTRLTPIPTCSGHPALDGELGCLTETVATSLPAKYSFSVDWPRHVASLTVSGRDRALALRIIRSAHAVPVDRNGCAARRDPIEAPGKHDPAAVGGAPAVPADRAPSSMGVCWYIAHRLVASATLSATDAATVLRGASSAKVLFSPVGTPHCETVDRSDGVILAVRYARGGAAEGILHAAACPERAVTNGLAEFVYQLGQLADMPLALNYPATR